jgi:hypothetical protein
VVAYKDKKILLSLQLSGGTTDLYPQAKIIKVDGTLLSIHNLDHATEGLYLNYIDPIEAGLYTISYKVYEDDTHSIESTFYPDIVSDFLTVMEKDISLSMNDNKLDPATNTLTVYEEDGITPALVYDLFDINGNPAVNNIFYRKKRI